MSKEIRLGSEVKCVVTGFTGMVTSHIKYLNGCEQFGVTPRTGPDNKRMEAQYIDAQQLEVIGEGVSVLARDTGGPTPSGTPTSYRG